VNFGISPFRNFRPI